MRYQFFLIIFLVLAIGCGDDDTPALPIEKQLEIDIAIIDTYLESKNIIAIKDPSGVRVVIHYEGQGTVSPTLENCVKADYIGKTLGDPDDDDDDKTFDAGSNVGFPLAGVIQGWQKGFPLLQVGDSATLYIPSSLGYGARGSGASIPKNANLYFGVKLNRIGVWELNPANGSFVCNQ